jgi:DNA-directed RNA polymerase specialized sigma24 family protein
MRDLSALESMRCDIEAERVAYTVDVQGRMVMLVQRALDHLDVLSDAVAEAHDRLRAAERVIDTLDNPRWKQVLAFRYLGQMSWAEVAEELHSTLDSVKAANRRALDFLDFAEERDSDMRRWPKMDGKS